MSANQAARLIKTLESLDFDQLVSVVSFLLLRVKNNQVKPRNEKTTP